MSAPKTNIDTQKRRHRWPLVGMAAAALFGVTIIVYWLLEEAATTENPQANGSQIEVEDVQRDPAETGYIRTNPPAEPAEPRDPDTAVTQP